MSSFFQSLTSFLWQLFPKLDVDALSLAASPLQSLRLPAFKNHPNCNSSILPLLLLLSLSLILFNSVISAKPYTHKHGFVN